MMKLKFAVLAIVLLVFGIADIHAIPVRYTVGGKLAAVSEGLLEKALSYQQNGDEKSLKELEKAFLVIKLKQGADIEIVKEGSKNSDFLKILLIDADVEVWTTKDALKMYTPEEIRAKQGGGKAGSKTGGSSTAGE